MQQEPKMRGANEWRSRATQTEEAEMPTIDLTLPSGFVVKATRPPLEMWLLNDAIPTAIIDKALEAYGQLVGEYERVGNATAAQDESGTGVM